MALTGAGVSTESSIPDYRGPRGSYSTGFKPMTHQQVFSSCLTRHTILRAPLAIHTYGEASALLLT